MSDENQAFTNNVIEVNKILNLQDDKLDNYLEFCEKNITDKILDFCNIETITERLNSLIQEFLLEQYKLNEDGILEGKKQVSSASDTNQSISFETVGGANSISQNVDEFLDRNIATLITYRKMRW